jgi:type I restriction enzyme S subunit
MTDVNKLITDNIDVWTSAIKKRSKQGRGSSKKIELTGVKKLRELILELAVRGKLVLQDANDEPASVLLERIAEEKAQLIKEGKIKKQKPLPVMIDEVKPFNLPHGWEWSKLQNIGHDLGQKTPDQDFTYIDVASINKELGFIEEPNILIADNAPSRARKLVKKGTVIYSTVRPYLLNIAVINDEFSPEPIASTAFSIIHPLTGVLASYVYRYLRSPIFISYVESVQTGIAYPAINDKQFFSGLIAMPPEAEQQRIVAKVDELMALCDQLEQQTEESLSAHQTLVEVLLAALTKSDNTEDFQISWQRIAEHFDVLFTTEQSIEQLKQTILQLAVMGKLVPQNPSDKPASVLLEKIAEEKAQLIADKNVTSKRQKQKPLPAITDEEKPFELPTGWEWARVGNLLSLKNGYAFKSKYFVENKGEYILATPGSFYEEGGFRHRGEKTKYYDGPIDSEFVFESGDLIIPMTEQAAGLLGSAAFVPKDQNKYLHNQRLGKLSPYSNLTTLEFIYLFFNSSFLRSELARTCTGMKVRHTSPDRILTVLIPVMPPKEQIRIVAKVDELMTLCEQLKARLSDAQTTQLHLADAVVSNALGQQVINSEKKVEIKTMKITTTLTNCDQYTNQDDGILAALIKNEDGEADAKAIWNKSGLDLPSFYKQLKKEINIGYINPPAQADFE